MRRFALWIKRKLLWITIVVFAAALLQVLFISSSEASFRITGLILQLLGIGTVAHGIHETRKMFGHPSPFSIVKDKLRQLLKFGGRVRLITSNIQATSMTNIVRPQVWMNAKDNSNEERINAIETNLKYLNKRLCEVQNQIDQCERRIEKEIKGEQDFRIKADREIMEKIEAVETGGINISTMGVFWLFVGVIMSSVSEELSILFM